MFQAIPAPDVNYMFKVDNEKIKIRCKICSELTIKTRERRQCTVLVSLL